jgi:hypothetical protein
MFCSFQVLINICSGHWMSHLVITAFERYRGAHMCVQSRNHQMWRRVGGAPRFSGGGLAGDSERPPPLQRQKGRRGGWRQRQQLLGGGERAAASGRRCLLGGDGCKIRSWLRWAFNRLASWFFGRFGHVSYCIKAASYALPLFQSIWSIWWPCCFIPAGAAFPMVTRSAMTAIPAKVIPQLIAPGGSTVPGSTNFV